MNGPASAEERLGAAAGPEHAFLDSLFAGAPVGLGFWDGDLRYVRVNAALAEINGLAADAHAGKRIDEVIPDVAAVVEPLARRVLETGEAQRGVSVSGATPAAPGVLRHWSSTYFPVHDAAGAVVGVGAVVEEVTDRRHAEERSAAQHAVAAILAAADDAGGALPRLLEAVCETLAWDVAAYWSVDAARAVHQWVRPGVEFPGFVAATQRAELDPALLPGRATGVRHPVWIEDLGGSTLPRSAVAVAEGLHSGAAFPVFVDGVAVGALELFSRRRRPVDDAMVATLVAVGSQLGQFLRRRRAEDERRELLEAERHARTDAEAAATTLEKLERVAQVALEHLSLADLLEALLDRIVEVLDADAGAILLLDDADGRLHVHATVGLDEERARREPVPVGEGIAGRVAVTRSPVLIDDLDAVEVVGSVLQLRGLQSLVAIPIVAEDRVIGVVHAASLRRARFGRDDARLLQLIADRLTLALANARLLREAEERAQAARVLASVGDGVFLVDRGGVVRTWNRAAASATRLAPDAVVGRSAVEAIPGWRELVGRVPIAAGRGPTRAASLPLDLGERELWLSIHGVAVPDGVVYAFRDLTEERALEELKTEFVSTVSHELRTPLAAIYGAAMTLRRSDVPLPEEQRDILLGVISSEADRLARTVNDILWASRLDTGTMRVAISHCDPVELAQDVVDAQRTHLDEHHEVRLTPVEPLPEVAADPDKVRQVLINLVDNGVKYSPSGGCVDVRVEDVGPRVRFSVADEGIGIPPGEQRRVFEKFYRLDPNMTQGVGGTGLGLYICRELVRRMDGRIWVESEPGHGSTFRVELPVAT